MVTLWMVCCPQPDLKKIKSSTLPPDPVSFFFIIILIHMHQRKSSLVEEAAPSSPIKLKGIDIVINTHSTSLARITTRHLASSLQPFLIGVSIPAA